MPPLETPSLDKTFQAKPFHLIGVDGQYHSLESLNKQNGIVIAFICNHCPYVQAIAHKIAQEADELAKLGIGFVGINSNDTEQYPDDSYENMKLFAKQHNFNFPYLFDETQEVAKAYNAVCTPDFFGMDSNMYLRYRGRLDSSGKNDIPNAKRELFEAIQIIASGGDISHIRQYPSIGCSIKWKV